MELEKVSAEIRPRTSWEAIDLGVSLVRAHAAALWKGWMSSVYPLCLLILALSWNSLFWGVFLIWWLKPVWERVALHPLSRSLFGERLSWQDSMRVLLAELWKNKWLVGLGVGLVLVGSMLGANAERGEGAKSLALLWLAIVGLLFYRSSLSRCLTLPVNYLEGLSGKERKARIQVLSNRSSGAGVGLTVICLMMEFALFASQLWLLSIMLPSENSLVESFILELGGDEFSQPIPRWVAVLLALFYVNAMTLVAWFYTGGGFGLYLNTRTWTEGWDIELKFKGLGQRIGRGRGLGRGRGVGKKFGAGLGLLIVFFTLLGAPPLGADQGAQKILDREEFEVQTQRIYRNTSRDLGTSKEDGGGNASSAAGIFAGVGPFLFWIITLILFAVVIGVIVTNSHLFRNHDGTMLGNEKKGKTVTTVAGLNVEAEKLPSDLLKIARQLWESGQYQDALGLLYRGAISSLIRNRLVEIEESDTEMDCLRRVTEKGEAANASYFKILTMAWMSQAYAQRQPDGKTIEHLWLKWPFQERRKL